MSSKGRAAHPPLQPAGGQQVGGETPRTILLNSTVAAVLASALMILVHELVHLVVGRSLGFGATLYPFGVDHAGPMSGGQTALTAISGPVFSLVSGFLLASWQPLAKRGGFGQLLWLWFAFTSMMEGAGYLVITPFGAGDTAATADALGWPMWPRLVAGAVGIGLMFLIARKFAPFVARYAGHNRPRAWALAFYPWIIGTGINIALAWLYLTMSAMPLNGGQQLAVMMAGMAVLVFAPMSFIFSGTTLDVPYRPLGLRPVPVAGLVGLAVMLALNIALTRGFHVS